MPIDPIESINDEALSILQEHLAKIRKLNSDPAKPLPAEHVKLLLEIVKTMAKRKKETEPDLAKMTDEELRALIEEGKDGKP